MSRQITVAADKEVRHRSATQPGVKCGFMDLRDRVRAAYSSAAEQPKEPHPFPVGREFAESLGYPSESLDRIPSASVEAFAGVSNVPSFAEVPSNGVVLDLGCGAGLDSLLLASRSGRVIGVDFSSAMLERARSAANASAAWNVLFCQTHAELLPLGDGVIDAAVVNGIFNLNPARGAIIAELARCIRPGGHLYGAELILRAPLPPEVKASDTNWFARIAGAKEGDAFLGEFTESRFREARILHMTRNARTKSPAVIAAEFLALR